MVASILLEYGKKDLPGDWTWRLQGSPCPICGRHASRKQLQKPWEGLLNNNRSFHERVNRAMVGVRASFGKGEAVRAATGCNGIAAA